MKTCDDIVSFFNQQQKIIIELVEIGERFRKTPIVDDDFPSLRDQFDILLRSLSDSLKANKFQARKQTYSIDGCMGAQDCYLPVIISTGNSDEQRT